MMSLQQAHQLLPESLLVGNPELICQRVHTDTRSLQSGDLFVALKGQRFDGHDFLPELAGKGVHLAIAEKDLAKHGLSGLQVTNTLDALGTLAKHWRTQLTKSKKIAVIAVTGSNGKTTVTQMIASILNHEYGRDAHATKGNFNNAIGVPLTLLGLRPTHQAAVIELGMNHSGEIEALASMTAPTIALVNNAQREHQAFMGSVDAVALENGSVFQALPANGVAIFPADDAYSATWLQLSKPRQTLSFGLSQGDVTAQMQWLGEVWQVHAQTPIGPINYLLSIAGAHNVKNSLAALACCLAAQIPLASIRAGLENFQAVAGRSRTLTLDSSGSATKSALTKLTVIDDSYNANPDSVIAAIDLLQDLAGPRLLILGDMGEVGQQGAAFHEEVGAYALKHGVQLWTLGQLSRHALGEHFLTIESLMEALGQVLHSATAPAAVLIKGSRFMKMERVVQHLHAIYNGIASNASRCSNQNPTQSNLKQGAAHAT